MAKTHPARGKHQEREDVKKEENVNPCPLDVQRGKVERNGDRPMEHLVSYT